MKKLKRKLDFKKLKKINNLDIPSLIDELTEKEKRVIIEDWIKEQQKKIKPKKIEKNKMH